MANPVLWLENRGQWPSEFQYGGWIGSVWVGVSPQGLELHQVDPDGHGSARVDLRWTELAGFGCLGLDPAPGLFHDYHGDESQWVRNVRAYRAVELIDTVGGTRLRLGNHSGHLGIDVLELPAEAGERLSLVVNRDRGLSLSSEGVLHIRTAIGGIDLSVAFLENGTERRARAGRSGAGAVSWTAGDLVEPTSTSKAVAASPSPELLWSTLWGSVPTAGCNLSERAEDACVDPLGDVTVVGTVAGIDYLLTPGTFHTAERCDDIFVAKFDQQTGDLIYSARIGSTSNDDGKGVAVDSTGRATVVGWVGQGAQGFPTTPGAFDTVKSQPDHSAVVFRLSPDGGVLEYSTYIEGTSSSVAYGVAVAASGSAVVTGTCNAGFPVTPGAYSEVINGPVDVFVTRVDPTGSFLEFSTLLGGSYVDAPVGVALDEGEFVYVAGETGIDFPTTPGAYKSTWVGVGPDAFASCLDPTGSTLVWSTLLGGSNTDNCEGMAITPDGGMVVVGMTESDDLPTTLGALQPNRPGERDGWVLRVNGTGTSLVYGTYLGSPDDDWAYTVATDASGMVSVGGLVLDGLGFPVTPGAFQTVGFGAAFLTLLPPDGSKAYYTTFISGNGLGEAHAMTFGPDGLLTMGGLWDPTGGTGNPFPTTPNALVPNPLGSRDAFITTLYPLLQGVKLSGTSIPSCLGPVNANAITMPLAGQPFGLYCTQAPPDADGYLITFTWEFMPSIQPVKAGPEGFLETDLGNLPNTPGKLRRYRYAFRNTSTCPGQGPFCYSNLVVVQVQ